MECETPRRVSRPSIFPVAYDRMADGSELNANLMLAPGLQCNLEERFLTECFHHSVVRDRQLATAGDAMHLERFAFHKMCAQRSARMRRRSLHDGEVALGDVLPIALKRGLR